MFGFPLLCDYSKEQNRKDHHFDRTNSDFFFFYSSMVSTGTLDDIKFEILTNLHWNWNSVHRISFFLLGLDEVDPLLQRVHYLLILSSFA